MTNHTANPAHADRTEQAEANAEGTLFDLEALDLETLSETAGSLYGRSDESPSNLAWQVVNGLSEADARQALANAIVEALRANTNDDHGDAEEWAARED